MQFARDLNGTSEYVSLGKGLVSADKFTALVWFYPNSDPGADNTVLSIGTSGSVDHRHDIVVDWSAAADQLRLIFRSTAATAGNTTSSVQVGEWNSAVLIVRADNDRTLIHNGDLATERNSSSAKNVSDPNNIIFGARNAAAVDNFFDGRTGLFALYDIDLADPEAVALGRGRRHPLSVRRDRLVALVDFRQTPPLDLIGNNVLSIAGSPSIAQGPPILPFGPRFPFERIDVPTAGGLAIPVAMHSYRQHRAA